MRSGFASEDDRMPAMEPLEPRLLLDSHPLITEFMADNALTLQDAAGNSPDWIEICNPTDSAIPLDDYYLTDDSDDLTQWQFPAGETLAAGAYLLVFADNTNDPPVAGTELHANFALSADGEYLALVYDAPGATPPVAASEYTFLEQKTDVSYGVLADYDITTILGAGAEARTLIPGGSVSGWTGIVFNDAGWIQGPNEITGVGFESFLPGWAVHNYKATIAVDNLDEAEDVLADPDLQSWVESENIDFIDYWDSGGLGHFTVNNEFPGLAGTDGNDYVVNALGAVTVSSAGPWTFGVNSDDGFSLRIPGVTTTSVYNSSTPYNTDTIGWRNPRGTADTTGVFDFPAAGRYEIEVVFYERGGGAALEVYAAQGSFSDWASGGGNWRLVGDTASGGLPVESESVDAGTGAAESLFDPFIGTNVESVMRDVNATAYIRIPFTVADPAAYDSLFLRMKYDDGFVAHLNGAKIAERNAPASPAWNASATAEHPDPLAIVYENIDVTATGSLAAGANVLAIQGLNLSAGDADFLILPELADMEFLGWAERYFLPTPGGPNGEGYLDFVEDTTFDHDRGFYTAPFDLAIASATVGAEIYYTTNGTSPKNDDGTPSANAIPYAATIPISQTTVLRAYAWKQDHVPTNVDTQTYIFTADVVSQSPDGSRPDEDKALIGGDFEINQEDFAYADDAFNTTNNPAEADGTLDATGGVGGSGGLKVALGPGAVAGGLSGAWSNSFTMPWADTATVALSYRMIMGPGYEAGEFGEVILAVDGTRYGSDTNTSLVHVAGDANPATTQDTGWLQATFDIALTAGSHTITIGAYNNAATEATEWTDVFFDDVTVTMPLWPVAGYLNGQHIDYGMDPDIVNDPTWGPQVEAALVDIPTFSLVMDTEDLYSVFSGIYTHAGNRGREWERELSVEYIDPVGLADFQVNAGVRIRGGFSRSGNNPKHAFRLFFRGTYGDSKLDYDLWPDEDGATSFDNLDLRTAQNHSWSFQNSGNNTFARDVYSRDMQHDMDQPYTRSDYCHLYINGQYFGLFQTQERPEADYAETYFGGDADDYDAVKSTGNVGGYQIEATDGNMDAWTGYYNTVYGVSVDHGNGSLVNHDVYMRLQGLNPDGSRNPAYPVHLDVDNLVDYMISTMYVGDKDAPISGFLGNDQPNNFYAIRDQGGDQGWMFFRHDAEHTLDMGDGGLYADRTGPWSVTAGDQSVWYSNPQWFHIQLCWNDEYRVAFADRVHELFYNDGLLTVDVTTADFLERAAEIDLAIIGESARWGDAKKTDAQAPFTKSNWQGKLNDITSNYFPNRESIFLNQLRIYNSEHDDTGTNLPLYPGVTAPTFSQHGGEVPVGFDLELSAPGGTIYYTTDGSDPRAVGGGINTPSAQVWTGSPITLNLNAHVRARVLSGGTWSAMNQAVFVVATTFDLRITEIMYHPAGPTAAEQAAGFDDQDLFEYLEIRNTGATGTINLAGIELSNGVDFTFPSRDLAPGEYILIVKDTDAFEERYGTGFSSLIVGEFENLTNLSNGGERVELSTIIGNTIQNFRYEDGWFDHTDGDGYSLVVRDPLQDPALWDSKDGWRASWLSGGNPGAADPSPLSPGDVVINEVLAHQDTHPPGDWIELHNTTGSPVTITGWFLSDDPGDLDKWQITSATTIPPHGYRAFTEASDFGGAFALSEFGEVAGDAVFLTASPDGVNFAGYREDEYFGPSLLDVSFGRYEKPSGGKDFVPMAGQTFEAPNSGPVIHDVVISEIMYNPATGNVEYIELANRTGADFPLYDPLRPENPWKFTDGVLYDFPAGAYVPAGGYALVVPTEPATFRSAYGIPASVNIYGPYAPYALNDAGERIQLSLPGKPEFTNPPPGELPGYVPYIEAEKITYNDKAPWPTRPDGGGSSLERLVLGTYGNDVANWGPSTTGGTPGAFNTGIDSTTPTAPAGALAAVVSEYQVDLTWTAAADPDTGIGGYRVYRDGLPVADVTGLTYSDTGVAAGNAYVYTVAAFNGDDVEGPASAPATADILGIESLDVIDATHLDVTFTDTVTPASAQNTANYDLIYGQGNAITVTGAALQPGDTTVRLTLAGSLAADSPHALAVGGVQAQAGTLIAPGSRTTFHYGIGGPGTITMEWWHGIGGTAVSDLTNNPRFPDSPDGRDWRTIFEIPVDAWEQYGARLYGYVVPSVTGNYTFWITSDDNSDLYLSTDDDPANKSRIAYVSAWTSSRAWYDSDAHPSSPITLQAGRRYYIEAIVKEGGGGDNLAVAWTLPGETPQANGPIPGANLVPFMAPPVMVTVGIQANDPDADEQGADPGQFTVTRTGNTADDLLVYYAVAGSASAGDYGALDGWIEIPAGQVSVTIDVTPADDPNPESDETVIVSLAGSAYYYIDTPTATVTIADNDAAGPPAVSIVASDPDAAEAGADTGEFTISRAGLTDTSLRVYYTVGGTATGGTDYTPALGTYVDIPAGEASETVTITPTDDGEDEPDETVILTLATDAAYTIETSEATVTIADDDLPRVSITASDPDAAEAGPDTGTFTVSRVGLTDASLRVYYTVGGTATGGTDYTPALGTYVDIPAGQVSETVTITPTDDGEDEPDETVILTLATDAAYTIETSEATVTIADDDLPRVSITASDPDAAEAGPDTGTFTVSRVGLTDTSLRVYYTVGGTASAGDYTPALGTYADIPVGQASTTITITPDDDGEDEPDETVILTLATDPTYTIETPEATVTIADDDTPAPQVVSVALNRDPRRTARGLGQIDPSALGVETVLVTFSKDVTFLAGDVGAEKVEFDALGSEISTVPVVPASVVYGATDAKILITFADSWQQMVDTWVRITLADTITDGGGQALDGEPAADSSGLGYIYDSGVDLPSGNGAAGGAAVFYVGSLRADMRGYGLGDEEPDGEITPWDITGFTQKYLSGNLDADMAGYGPGQTQPDTDVNPWDISGFTSRYSAAMAAGTHLELLPTGGEGLAVGTPAPLPLVADAFGVADETVVALTAAPEIGLLTRTSDEQPAPSDGRVAWPRLRGHVLPRPAVTMATQHRVAMPPALVASADPAPSASAPWSPAAPDTAATDSTLAADGGLVDLLAAPALDVLDVL